jgi:hypothetical protein
MRVAPVGWACADERSVLREAERSAAVTHNHPEGVKGAQATALAVFMARRGASKDEIRDAIASRFGYDLNRTIGQIRPTYHFDVTCQGTVPEALIAFFESTDYESAVRLAISLGGDSDTLAAITGGIAHAFYRVVPDTIVQKCAGGCQRNSCGSWTSSKAHLERRGWIPSARGWGSPSVRVRARPPPPSRQGYGVTSRRDNLRLLLSSLVCQPKLAHVSAERRLAERQDSKASSAPCNWLMGRDCLRMLHRSLVFARVFEKSSGVLQTWWRQG